MQRGILTQMRAWASRSRVRRALLLMACVGGLSTLFIVGVEQPAGTTTRQASPSAPAADVLRQESAIEVVAARLPSLGGGRGDVAANLATVWLDRAWASSSEESADSILTALRHPKADVRWVALLAAPRYGPADDALTRAVLERAEDPSPAVRHRVAATIETLVDPSPKALDLLRRATADADSSLRGVLLRTLGRHDGRPKTLDLLLEGLVAEDASVRRAAAFGIVAYAPHRHQPERDDVVEHLTAALADTEATVRSRAARALAPYGEAARPAIPALIVCLHGDDKLTTRWAMDALVACGEAAVPALAEAIAARRHPSPTSLVWGLGRIEDPRAHEALRLCLRHDDPRVRAASALALQERGGSTPTLVATLAALLGEQDPDVLASALQGLGLAGTEVVDEHRARIERLRKHGSPTVRQAAEVALAGRSD